MRRDSRHSANGCLVWRGWEVERSPECPPRNIGGILAGTPARRPPMEESFTPALSKALGPCLDFATGRVTIRPG